MRIRVNDTTQINHDGRVYAGGEEIDLPSELASTYIEGGLATEVRTKRRTAREARNKKGE
jgi:hypothetical protein